MADAITETITINKNAYIAGGIIYINADYDEATDTLTGGTAAYELTGGTAVAVGESSTSAITYSLASGKFFINGTTDNPVFFTGNTATTSGNGGAAIYTAATATLKIIGAEVEDLTKATIVFSNNTYIQSGTTATRGGGAIQINNTGASLYVSNVNFSNNTSSRHGGAIYIPKVGTATLNNVLFSSNSAGTVATDDVVGVEGNGGAINIAVGRLSLTNVTFSGNSATNLGGAVYITGSTTTMTLSNVTFSNNTSKTSSSGYYTGGALYINAGTVTIEGLVSLLSNTDTIYVKNGGVLQVDVSKFSGPVAEVVKANGAVFTGGKSTSGWLVSGSMELVASGDDGYTAVTVHEYDYKDYTVSEENTYTAIDDGYGYAFVKGSYTAAAIVTADHAHGIVDANGTVYFGGAFASLDDAFASAQYNNVAIDNLTVNEALTVDAKYLIITGSCTVSAALTTKKSITVTGATFNFGNSETITVDGNYTAAAALNFTGSGSVTFSGLDFTGSTTALSITVGSVTGPLTVATGLSNVSAVSVKVGEAEAQSVTVSEIFVVDDTKYKLTNDASGLVLSVVPGELVIDTAVSTDEKGNYTNTTGALEVTVKDGAEIANNLYAAISGTDAKLTVTGGNIKNIFAGAKLEADAKTGDITATVGGGNITTTRVYCGNAVLGGTVTTENTTLKVSGELAYQVQKDGVWCYGAGIANAGLLNISGTSTVKVEASGSVGSVVGGGRAQNSGSLDVNATSVTIDNATVTNAIGGAYNNGTGSVTVGTAEMSISSRNVTTVFGGNFITASSTGNTISNVNLTINGAEASNAVFGGNYMKAGSATITGTVTLDINGGSATSGFYGGGFIVGAATETITEVNITVDGTVIGNIFAGACVSGEGGSSTVEKATITISGNVTGNVYAGGYSVAGAAAVKDSTIIFSGSSVFNGKVCATSAGKPFTGNNPAATVVFSSYDGNFGGAFAGTFDVIEFTADSSVNFTRTDFDGLKTDAVQITGMDTITYADDASGIFFDLGKKSYNGTFMVGDAVLSNPVTELSKGKFTYYWDNENNVFGYAGYTAAQELTGKADRYTLYQLA